MLRFLFRFPADLQMRVITGLLFAAGLSVLFGLLCVAAFSETTETSGALWWKKTTEIPLSERSPWLIAGVLLMAVALVCAVVAIRLFLMHGAAKKYVAILSGVESIKIRRIADITKSSPSKVYGDIQAMIDSGTLEDFYIDYGIEQVVSKKFVPKNSHKTVVVCSGCHGHNEVIVGITKACSFCRQPLVMERP